MGFADPPLVQAVGQVLTGQVLPVPDGDARPASTDAVVQWLACQGWDAQMLTEHRESCRSRHQVWPHPLDPALARAITGRFAQYQGLVRGVRARLGADGLVPTERADRPLSRDEARLLAERPPHHGVVG